MCFYIFHCRFATSLNRNPVLHEKRNIFFILSYLSGMDVENNRFNSRSVRNDFLLCSRLGRLTRRRIRSSNSSFL